MAQWQMVEVVGSSSQSIQEAVRVAVRAAGVRTAKWFEVREIRGVVTDGEVGEFQVRVAVGYETS